MQVTEKIRTQLNSWTDVYSEFIQSEAWDNIFRALKQLSSQKKTIIPKSDLLFKSFELCDRHKLKAVIVLMDPYPVIKKDVQVANGVPLDCSNTKMLQPSLYSWWEQVEKVYSETIEPDLWQSYDLSWLLKDEHVLLVNSSLTTEEGKPGVHAKIWEPFMKHLFKVLNENYRALPIVLMGNQAQQYEKEINPLLHHILKCEHPVMGSRNNRAWDNKDCFNWINRIIENNNGSEEKIMWYKKKEQLKKVEHQLPDWVTHKSDGTPHDEIDDLPFKI